MATIGQTRPTRDRDLPDPCGEVRELRRMVRERDEEIGRLREALKEAYRLTDTFCRDMTDEAFQELEQHFKNALNGGGEQNA